MKLLLQVEEKLRIGFSCCHGKERNLLRAEKTKSEVMFIATALRSNKECCLFLLQPCSLPLAPLLGRVY